MSEHLAVEELGSVLEITGKHINYSLDKGGILSYRQSHKVENEIENALHNFWLVVGPLRT